MRVCLYVGVGCAPDIQTLVCLVQTSASLHLPLETGFLSEPRVYRSGKTGWLSISRGDLTLPPYVRVL